MLARLKEIVPALLFTSIFFIPAPVSGFQVATVDTLLFTIRLNDDSTGLFFRSWSENIRSSLAGPVLMANNVLLFHSRHGYALYDMNGKLIETHSLVAENMRAAAAEKPQTFFAYPFDGETLIYYTDTEPVRVFRKTLRKKGLTPVSPSEMEMFKDIRQFEPLNIYRSGTTEDIGRKGYLRPHLVGFTALDGGSKWWSTDVFFSFTSPMVMETDGRFSSFFPGLQNNDNNSLCDVRVSLISSLGVFQREGRWYYLGVYSNTGETTEDEYYQTVVLCDQAGNMLYCSQLLKQGITEVVIRERRGHDRAVTIRGAGRHVFIPAVDPYGDIYYGLLDRERMTIEVFKRSFFRFLSRPAAPAFGDEFDREGRLTFKPINLECSEDARDGVMPEVHSKNDAGGIDTLDARRLTKDSLYVKVHRLPDPNLQRQITRISHTMPKEIGMMQDSVSKLPTTWCPYAISLNRVSCGRLATLNYGFGDIIVNAWILGVSESGNIYVRVDLENWAEVVVFTLGGHFLERFTFNNTHYSDRKDIVVLAPNDIVYERDYEAGADMKGRSTSGHRFMAWEKNIMPLMPIIGSSAPQRKKGR